MKEILKNPKLVRKAIKHKDLCKQMFNRVQVRKAGTRYHETYLDQRDSLDNLQPRQDSGRF